MLSGRAAGWPHRATGPTRHHPAAQLFADLFEAADFIAPSRTLR
jgi:hypothetical protein